MNKSGKIYWNFEDKNKNCQKYHTYVKDKW